MERIFDFLKRDFIKDYHCSYCIPLKKALLQLTPADYNISDFHMNISEKMFRFLTRPGSR